MATPEELFSEVLTAVRRLSAARQTVLEARARLRVAEDEERAADEALAAARTLVDTEIDVAVGRRPRPDPQSPRDDLARRGGS